MADYGLTIRNQDNYLQIDSTFRNFVLVSKQTVTTSGGGFPSATVSTSGLNFPIVAISTTANAYMLGTATSTTIYTPGTTASITVYIFDIIQAPATANYGLQVYNSSGQLCFDSGWKAMKVLDFFTEAVGNGNAAARTYTGKTIAAVQVLLGCVQTVLAGPNIPVGIVNQDLRLFTASSTTFYAPNYQYAVYTSTSPGVPAGYENFGTYNYGFLILDVSNY